MSKYSQEAWKNQQYRNDQLIENSKFMRSTVTSKVLPFSIDIANTNALDQKQIEINNFFEISQAEKKEGKTGCNIEISFKNVELPVFSDK